jgi:O-antigen ligase
MSDITFNHGSAVMVEGVRLGALSRERVLPVLDRLGFISLTALIVLVAIPYGAVEPWWISLYECAVFSLGAFWICEGLLAGDWKLQGMRLVLPAAALAAFVFLQSIDLPTGGTLKLSALTISADPFETRLTFLKLLAFLINGLLLMRYTSTRFRMRAVIHVVVAVAVTSAVFGIARQALQHHEAGFILPYLRRDSGFGQFVNKNHFAFLMEMAIGLAAGLMLGGAVRRERLLIYLSAVALMWIGLVLTSSRGGLLSMLGQIAFLLVALAWSRSARRGGPRSASRQGSSSIVPAMALSACLIAVVAVGAVWVGGDVLATRLASLSGEIKTEAPEPHAGVRRREVWNATWQLIRAHPLVGSGFGAFSVAITEFHDASGKWTPEAAHNDYLELLASGGLAGALIVIWFGLMFIKLARRRFRDPETFSRAASLGALTGIFGVMTHNVVDFGLHVTANAVVFIALIVIATRDLRAETQTDREPGSDPN